MQTILVVDDDAAFAAATENMLVDAGYRVLKAPDGNRAVRLLDEMRNGIDLAIVDLSLPGINGFELIGALCRRPNSVKVIATTSVFNDAQLASATAIGAHAAIRKPRIAKAIPAKDWLSTIRKLIGNN